MWWLVVVGVVGQPVFLMPEQEAVALVGCLPGFLVYLPVRQLPSLLVLAGVLDLVQTMMEALGRILCLGLLLQMVAVEVARHRKEQTPEDLACLGDLVEVVGGQIPDLLQVVPVGQELQAKAIVAASQVQIQTTAAVVAAALERLG